MEGRISGQKQNRKRYGGESGSAAIEAVVSLTIFIVGIMTILSFINICRAQAAVSCAVDAAAKEMSQYAYFYHLCGLDELQQKTEDKVKEDREKLENIAGGTMAMYTVFQTLDSDQVASQDIVDLVNGAVDTMKESSPQTETVTGTAITMENAAGKIDRMIDAVASVKDPMQFMKSMVTIGAMEGASFLRSQLIAAPLARILTEKHFQVDGMSAGAYLRTMNIDGMDALNFKMSTIFAPTTPDDIRLVCYYQMKPVKFFNFDFGTITLCKESVTRAWLGGDREYKADKEKEDKTGVWDMPSLQYGKHIVNAEVEKLLKQGCYDIRGSGADAFSPTENTWIHIRSMDIYSDSYKADPNAVKRTLLSEYNKLVSAAGSSGETVHAKEKTKGGGTESVELPSPAGSRKLRMIVVIPEGEETETFKEGLKMFQEETGFICEVVHGYGTSPKNRKDENSQDTEGDA